VSQIVSTSPHVPTGACPFFSSEQWWQSDLVGRSHHIPDPSLRSPLRASSHVWQGASLFPSSCLFLCICSIAQVETGAERAWPWAALYRPAALNAWFNLYAPLDNRLCYPICYFYSSCLHFKGLGSCPHEYLYFFFCKCIFFPYKFWFIYTKGSFWPLKMNMKAKTFKK